ncbi:MAG: hypothetical protein WCJ09_23340 [Planctomycetota bacterium]
MPITVICDECSESHRVREDAVGKRFKCKGCGKGLTIDAPRKKRAASDEEDYEDYDEDDETEDYDDAEPVRRSAGKSKAMSSSRSKRSKSLPIHKTMIVPGLRLAATGFGLMVLYCVCFALLVMSPQNMLTYWRWMNILLACASIATAIGKVLCMSVPPQMSGRPFIYIAALADVVTLCISFSPFFLAKPPSIAGLDILILMIGTYCFVLFLRELGRFQRDDVITHRATTLLNLFGFEIGIVLFIFLGFFLRFIPIVVWVILSMLGGVVAFILGFVCVVYYAMLLSACLDSVS